MHIATHNWMRPESIKRTIERMRQVGVDAIEISGEPDQYNARDVRALLKDNGRRCWGSVTLTLGERNLASKNAAQREKTVEYMKRVVTLAKELDGRIVTVVPATVGKVVADGTPQQEWQWLVEGLKEVYAHSERAGIQLAIEPLNRFETYLINRGDQAQTLADAVGPNVGVCLDLFHMNIEESDILGAFRKAKGRIVDVHIADNNRFAPGMGTLDFPAIVETIRGTGYDGALTLEFVATVDRTPASPYGEQVETNPVDVTPEQMQFIIDHGSNLLSDAFYTGLFERSVKVLRPLI
jgi:sugar phosphate isomerase/epimerase